MKKSATYLKARIQKGGIARIIIERTLKRITVTIHTSRPGIIIGKGGQEVDRIREELKKLTGKDVQINIIEIRKPELDANIVGESIAKQLKHVSIIVVLSKWLFNLLCVQVQRELKSVSPVRLNGAEMARSEEYKEGRTPLHTFRADIDYALQKAQTVYGKLVLKSGFVKVKYLENVICRQMLELNSKDDRRGKRGGGGGGRWRTQKRRWKKSAEELI